MRDFFIQLLMPIPFAIGQFMNRLRGIDDEEEAKETGLTVVLSSVLVLAVLAITGVIKIGKKKRRRR